ncbi:hypothetical protein Ngar_c19670 [Candidatus Nitrososphaera gargensis Ga9.2]|uniref:Uncharacterized protein n=1 Tax=Nitrososphaera gargensis (strain Ga9.2) TaxID=1237085 RepID=K0IN78_NITGG|nr:hypothetical protein [Candidatus Nitrososphaera gargensis]AFU58899.1 hypothetical protein Ngar_c19670 [Candidatus Nitrososphaera gargensis Ga9.2]
MFIDGAVITSNLSSVSTLVMWIVISLVASLALSHRLTFVRGGSEQEQAKGQRIIVGGILGGVVMYLAPYLATWLTGIDYRNPPANLPPQLVSMVGNLLTMIQYIGVAVIIGGITWGAIELTRNRHILTGERRK